MKVFLSWSGPRSFAVAEALGPWFHHVLQAVDPWISSEIDKGVRWRTEIADRLEEARVGIICLTPENLEAPWLLFEAGALSKTRDAYVCTFLLGLKPADVREPLAQFQHTLAEEGDVRRLVHTINRVVGIAGGRRLSDGDVEATFNKWWPDLKDKLEELASREGFAAPPGRSERELLEELLNLTRAQEQRYRVPRDPGDPVTDEWREMYARNRKATRDGYVALQRVLDPAGDREREAARDESSRQMREYLEARTAALRSELQGPADAGEDLREGEDHSSHS